MKGVKPISRKKDVLDGDPPLVIVECECGANTIARRPTAITLLGWRVEWPEKTVKMMRVVGVCPKCLNTRA
jgi:lysyl-tRNA synthetase class I